ncbi:MAG: AAA family ATPase [archaeon]
MGKVIGVISLKGGVGKTSVVTALGDSIANFNKKVLLIDGNLSAPNLGLYLDIINPKVTLHDVLARKANISEAVYGLDNLDVIPSGLFSNLEVNPFLLRDKIKDLKRKYDSIIIDSSPSLGNETLAVMLASDRLIVVTTPDYPTLSTTLKAIKLAKQRGTKIDGLIINKAYGKKFELSFEDIESTLEVPVLAVIPYDINVLKALSEFTPSTSSKPKSKASEEYKHLGAILIGEKYKASKLKRLDKWINPKRQEINREVYYRSVFGN